MRFLKGGNKKEQEVLTPISTPHLGSKQLLFAL